MGLWTFFLPQASTKKADAPKPAGMADFATDTSPRAIPVIFGTAHIKTPIVLWYGDLRVEPIMQKSGKKG